MTQLIRTIDAHVGGRPVRLVVDGMPTSPGRTLARRVEHLRQRSDHVRRALIRPPRGHEDLSAAILTAPITPGADAGVICMDAAGYPLVQGEAIIAAATIALERELIYTSHAGPETRLTFDTRVGTVIATARSELRGDAIRVDSVALTNIPAFVHTAAQSVQIRGRELRVDIAFGGVFHGIVDTEAIGIPLDAARLPDLRRLAIDVLKTLNAAGAVQHPLDNAISGVATLTITSAPRDPEAHLRNVTIGAGGAVDAGASVTGTSAAMAVLDAMGMLPDDQPFIHEGMTGSLLRGRLLRRTEVGDRSAIVTEITGSAWITGEHTFVLNDDDPFREGYSL